LGAKKDRGTGFSVFCPREKWGESQKIKEGGGGGDTPIPRLSLLPTPTVTLATQAIFNMTRA